MADPRLDALLDRYQHDLDDGRAPDLDDLCRDCPDLRPELERQVDRLHRMRKLLGESAPSARGELSRASSSADATWVHRPGPPSAPAEIPAPPGYEVLAPLGEGGMGVVYKAHQVGLDRLVALKMVLGGARAVDLARFRDEAQAIAALRHPNIVQVYETGVFRNLPFFSLEFCAGGSLSKALNAEPQPPRTAAQITKVLARAVHYAHTRGIVHRDLKPANVLLSSRYQVASSKSTIPNPAAMPDRLPDNLDLATWHLELKVSDFGLAKRVDNDTGRTLDGSIMGTPDYMAPEQALGATREISPATDVHALGAILYELLTGRPPFRGSSVHDTLEQVRYRDPVRVRELQPRVPADVETICLKCLQKDPKKRYPSAEAVAEDLRRFLAGKPIVARPIGHLERTWRWCRREPRTAGLVAALVVLVVLLPAVLVRYGTRLGHAEALLDEQRKTTVAALRAEQAALAAEETQRYFAGLSEARRLRSDGRPGWTWTARAKIAEAAAADTARTGAAALRAELATALAGIDLRPVASAGTGVQAGVVAFDPNGRLAIAPQILPPFLQLKAVLLFDPRTGTTRELPFKVGLADGLRIEMATALAFSPDGRWLFLAVRGGEVIRWDLEARPEAVRTNWQAHKGGMTALAVSPDSRWLYTGGQDGRVHRWSIDGSGPPAATWPANVNPSGKVSDLAYWAGPRTGILVHGPAGTRLLDPQTLTEVGPGTADGADWVSPNVEGTRGRIAVHAGTGTIVVATGGELEVTYWERGVRRVIARLRDPGLEGGGAHAGAVEDLAFHPSGMLLATVSPEEGAVKVWHLGTRDLTMTVPAANARAVAFSADGSRLAVGADHTTILYEVGGLSAHTFVGLRGLPVRAVGLTPDGLIATVAAGRKPDLPGSIASIWRPDGTLAETVFHRADGPADDRCRIASSRIAGCTALYAGGQAVAWRDRDGTRQVEYSLRARPLADLAITPAGQCWAIEGSRNLGVRPVANGQPARPVSIGWVWNGRQGLVCVRAAEEHVLVGCENGLLRVVRPDGSVATDVACYDESPATLFTESANTVHAVAVTADNTEAVAGTEDGRLWRIRLPDVKAGRWSAHTDRVTAVAFDSTGRWLASGGRDGLVRLWTRAETGFEPYLDLRAPGSGSVAQVLFAEDRLLVLHEREAAVRVWHLNRLRPAFTALGVER